MTSSTWGGLFKGRRRAPEPVVSDANTEERPERQQGVEVAFESLEYDDGQPFIALVFLRGGVPIAPSGRVFTFELAPGTSKLEADTLASLLNRRITHLVETQTDPDIACQETPEPDGVPAAPKADDPEAADGPTYTPV